MTILDLNQLDGAAGISADLCIVGAGAAGISIALQFIGTGIDVVLLESGGRVAEAATQSLYEGTVADERLHAAPEHYRQRRFGGSTTIWGGRCIPFDPIDFEKRDYIPDSGWPISFQDLVPYYGQANRLCEAGEFAYTVEQAFRRPLRPVIEGFESENFSIDSLERFSCPTDFGARYGHEIERASNIQAILHANVTDLKLDADGRAVVAATARSLRGRAIVVRARQFVLATGGLEVARLLLANRDIHPTGIGNQGDAVGRYYMCHLAGTLGTIRFRGPLSSVWHGYEVAEDGTYCRRRFALRETVQRRFGLANFVGRLHHPRIIDPQHRSSVLSLLFLAKYLIPYEYRTRLHGSEPTTLAAFSQHLRNVILDPGSAISFAWHMLRDRKLAKRKFPSIIVRSRENIYSLDFHAEQRPSAASRVTLGETRDRLGVPRLHIDWRYEEGDLNTVCRSIELFAADIQRCKLGLFQYDPASVEQEMVRYGAYGGHHIGTARMGTDHRKSVVDADCRVHSVRNLYIASAATFPTSGQANPTLTVVALSLRLADHVKSKLKSAGN